MTSIASKGQLRASVFRWALFTVPLTLLLGYLSGYLASSGSDNPWFSNLVKPSLFPPPALFGIVWTALYAAMGFALALVCAAWGAKGRKKAITAYIVQFVLNLMWSPVFFAMHQMGWALAIIIALDIAVAITMVFFWRVRPAAGWIFVPYLAWVLFATLLNWQFIDANPYASNGARDSAVRVDL